MKAEFKWVRDLFSKSGGKFEVPEYQRGYEWEKKHFQDLWADLERIGQGVEKHYLGNIILLKKKGSGKKVFDIVDGQQRMITISILMMAIRDAKEVDNQEDELIKNILNSYPTEEPERKIELFSQKEDKEFEALWQRETEEPEGTVGTAYKFYRRKISDWEEGELDELKTKILNQLQVVETESTDRSLAYMVFQSQNERGKEVEPHILAKARIFGEADGLNDEQKKREIKGRWKQIYRRLEDELGTPRIGEQYRVRRPLSQILVISDHPTPTRIDPSALYRNFDEALQNTEGVHEFVNWFDERVEDYLKVTSSDYEIHSRRLPNGAARELKYLNSVSTHAEVLSLSILNNTEDEDLLEHYFQLASTLGMRMQLGSPASRDKREAIYSTAKKVRENGDIRQTLREAIQEKTPTDSEIIEHLKANPLPVIGQWGFRPTLYLSSIEEQRRSSPLRVDVSDLHLEHVAPRRTFKDSSYSKWRRELSSVDGEDDFDNYKNLLGNLTLLSSSDHASLDESSFQNKKNSYKNSDMTVTEELSDYDEWGIEQIENRTKRLAGELTEKWSI